MVEEVVMGASDCAATRLGLMDQENAEAAVFCRWDCVGGMHSGPLWARGCGVHCCCWNSAA